MLNQKNSTSPKAFKKSDLSRVEEFAKAKRTSVLVIFFDDMQGSTVIKQRITALENEEAFQDIRREHDAILEEIIHRDKAGEIIKSTGDGIIAVFSEPSTAVERAMEIQQRLQNHPHVKVRIGIDMGQVRVERAGGVQEDLFGRHVDWAARVTSMAAGGHILVTRPVYVDAFGWIPKAQAAWQEHGFYRKKEEEEAIEVFEPYNTSILAPMKQLNAGKVSEAKVSRRDLTVAMTVGTACLCLIVLTLGAVVAVIKGIVPVTILSTAGGLGLGGSFLGFATLMYKLILVSLTGKVER